MSIKDKLESLGISYQGASKYYTACPECGPDRKKTGTKSLLVQLGDKAHVRCFHPECSLNKPKYLGSSGDVKVERFEYSPIPDSMEIPGLPAGASTYAYTDELGQIWMYIIRTLDKQFYPLSLTSSGNLIFNAAEKKMLYWLGDKDAQQIIVTEGEKAALAVRSAVPNKNVAVVTWPGGANGVQRGDWDRLAGRNVILWPDNDAPGLEAARQIAGIIKPCRLRQVHVEDLEEKFDAADLDTNSIIDRLRNLEELGLIEDGYDLSAYESFVRNYVPGPSIGWKELDSEVELPNTGVIVVSGRSGHGKSTSMINIIIQMLKNTDRKIVFYSMELTVEQVIEKMVNILDTNVKYKTREATLNDHYKWLKSKADSGQLQLVGRRLSLKKILAGVAKPIYKNAVVFVDYIQIMATENQGNDARYREIQQQVYDIKDEATKHNLLFFIGSQLTPGEYSPDSDKSRESADINNVADLHLKIWNKQAARATGAVQKVKRGEEGDGNDWYDEVPAEIVFSVVKNRWGRSGQRFGMHLEAGVRLIPASKKSNIRDVLESEY
jgi:KaiC/GvpD/RAD55 family RecA-like ATPase